MANMKSSKIKDVYVIDVNRQRCRGRREMDVDYT